MKISNKRRNKHGRTGCKRPMLLGKAEKQAIEAAAYRRGIEAGVVGQIEVQQDQLRHLATMKSIAQVRAFVAAQMS